VVQVSNASRSGAFLGPGPAASLGAASTCARMSGDALTRYQSALSARQSYVRAGTDGSPTRHAAHSQHAQFHCGNPPPAAVPSSSTLTGPLRDHA
jgi:hypothetical protein